MCVFAFVPVCMRAHLCRQSEPQVLHGNLKATSVLVDRRDFPFVCACALCVSQCMCVCMCVCARACVCGTVFACVCTDSAVYLLVLKLDALSRFFPSL